MHLGNTNHCLLGFTRNLKETKKVTQRSFIFLHTSRFYKGCLFDTWAISRTFTCPSEEQPLWECKIYINFGRTTYSKSGCFIEKAQKRLATV